MIIAVALIPLFLLVVMLIMKLIWGFFIISQGAFYAKSSDQRIKNIVKLADAKKGDKIVDLGSGDGIVLFSLADQGAKCTGIELDPYYIWLSKSYLNKYKNKDNIGDTPY